MYTTYVLYSIKFGRYYKGQTQNIEQRLLEHNTGKVRSTKPFVPWQLVYQEVFETRKAALQRERYFKSAAGRRFLKTQIKL